MENLYFLLVASHHTTVHLNQFVITVRVLQLNSVTSLVTIKSSDASEFD